MDNSGVKLVNILKTTFNIVFIALQLFLIYLTISHLSVMASITYGTIKLLSVMLMLYIINAKTAVSFKLTWVSFIMLFPISAMVFYLLWGNTKIKRKDKQKLQALFNDSKEFLTQDQAIPGRINNSDALKQTELISRLSSFPVWSNTHAEYLKIGEIMHKRMIEEIMSAEKFIFIEFYIIRPGIMYREFMDALIIKANQGVEIKFIYDAGGCLGILPKDFKKLCTENNISFCAFNPLSASLFNFLSFRNHRKIIIIDGNTCFTGGINIGDEYINFYEKHGHWKDMGIMFRGDAVLSFTVMFLNLWEFITSEHLPVTNYSPTLTLPQEKGFVMPYCDGPDNALNPACNLYMKMIADAKKYIYIVTPYLILNTDLICVLSLAARSGVDVRILTPHIPDKVIVHAATRSFYGELLMEGIRIFEYYPGFVHGKILVADDILAVVGSVNFDFRSLTWNRECAAWLHNQPCIPDIKKDFLQTLEVSREITLREWENSGFLKKMFQSVLRILSPLF